MVICQLVKVINTALGVDSYYVERGLMPQVKILLLEVCEKTRTADYIDGLPVNMLATESIECVRLFAFVPNLKTS